MYSKSFIFYPQRACSRPAQFKSILPWNTGKCQEYIKNSQLLMVNHLVVCVTHRFYPYRRRLVDYSTYEVMYTLRSMRSKCRRSQTVGPLARLKDTVSADGVVTIVCISSIKNVSLFCRDRFITLSFSTKYFQQQLKCCSRAEVLTK
jgi:hypothetical protein